MKTGKKTHWLRTTIAVLLICGIAGTVLAAVLFKTNPDKTYAAASIQFTFDGATDGLAPNKQAFRMEEIASDDILEQAVESSGLAGTLTPDDIRRCLLVRGTYPENMVEQVMSYESLLSFTANRELTVSDFHPTVFNLKLVNDFSPALSQSQLTGLLEGILTAYKAYFTERYSLSVDLSAETFDLDAYDYPQQLEILAQTMTQMGRYAQELYTLYPNFIYNGIGFNDINVRMTNLAETEVAKLNASITMNALTKDVARLLTQYQYQIQDLNNQLTQQQERLKLLDTLIASYDKNEIIYLSTAESLTKIDGNSSETYDELIENRKEVSDRITELNTRITNYQLRISDLMKETENANTAQSRTEEKAEELTEETVQLTEEEIAAAAAAAQEAAVRKTAALETNIDQLVVKRDAVTADFRKLLDAYNEQEINDGTVAVINQKYETPKFISGAFAWKVIQTAGPLCALGFMVCMILMIISRKREEKA